MKKVKEIVLSALEKYWAGLKTKVVLKSNIINNLTSTSTDAPLSASQGKVLKGEVDSLNEKKSNINHTHNYAGSATAGGSANSATKLDSNAGSATQPIYFSGGKPVACSYSLGKSVPANAVFTDTNTWRDVVNNLTSTDTNKSLSAAQGKALNDKINRILDIEIGGHLSTESDAQGFKFSVWSADYKYALYFCVSKTENAIIMNCVRNSQWGVEKKIYP